MAIFLGDITALRYWFGTQRTVHIARSLPSVPEYGAAVVSKSAMPWDQLMRLGIAGDLHIDVSSQASRHAISGISTHVLSNPAPFTFARLSDDVYVESPIVSLIRMAPKMSRGECVFLLNQLTGAYQVQKDGIVSRTPLATLDDVDAYIRMANGQRGVGVVRPLLPYVVGGTASPAEARVAAMLSLPTRWGGYGLPVPQANARIDVVLGSGEPAVRYADLLWPRWKLILEYDSDSYHVGAEKIGHDSDRRTVLQKMGFTVVTLTNLQVRSREKLDDVVRALCAVMGRRFRAYRDSGFAAKNMRLRSQLRCVTLLER